MASQFDESDFVDADLQAARRDPSAATATLAGRAPNREELDHKVTEAQQRLAELRQAQEELERERAALEEVRRRRIEFETGREEVLQQLVRGVEILEKAEFESRRDAEQMSKSLSGLREALGKVQSIQEELWKPETLSTELTKALTAVENARMEWTTARLKWSILSGAVPEGVGEESSEDEGLVALSGKSFGELCRLGFALTWPVALVIFVGFAAVVFVLLMPR